MPYQDVKNTAVLGVLRIRYQDAKNTAVLGVLSVLRIRYQDVKNTAVLGVLSILRIRCKMRLTSLHDSYGSWHWYICFFALSQLNTSFLLALFPNPLTLRETIFRSVVLWVKKEVGSITSRCSGNEPALLRRTHGWSRQFPFVGFNQSEQCPQNFVGRKLSRQFGLRPVMADDVELINGIREIFREKFKISQGEMLERFANGQDVFILQPTN